jgi:hypothetical protein
VRKDSLGPVSGHGFSRAAEPQEHSGFSPFALCIPQRLKPLIFELLRHG